MYAADIDTVKSKGENQRDVAKDYPCITEVVGFFIKCIRIVCFQLSVGISCGKVKQSGDEH